MKMVALEKSRNGEILEYPILDHEVDGRIIYVKVVLDCCRTFKFDLQGNQISKSPCYRLEL